MLSLLILQKKLNELLEMLTGRSSPLSVLLLVLPPSFLHSSRSSLHFPPAALRQGILVTLVAVPPRSSFLGERTLHLHRFL